MAENKLFRETALETVSSPEQLDQHIRVTKPLSWVILTAIIALVLGAGVWAFTGNVSSGTDIAGVIFAADGVSITNAPSAGVVCDVLVSESDLVNKGDIIAVIPDSEILAQLKSVGSENSTVRDALRYQYIINSFVTVNKSGSISSVPSVGDTIAEGQQVAVNYSEEATSGSKDLIAYVPYSVANGFKVGQEVQISPSNYPREEYGYMQGKITSIGDSLVTSDSIQRTMGTTKYISALGVTDGCVEIRVRLNVDSSTKSGYEWSNSKGASLISVDNGTLCNVKVVGEAMRPIDLII